MYLLDTNVISQFRKKNPDQGVLEWMGSQNATNFYISVLSVMELEIWVQSLTRRDADQARRLRNWMNGAVLTMFEGRILPIDLEVARRCAANHVPDPAPERDALIAATAAVRGFTVVTRNERDFRRLGVTLLNPFSK